MSSISNILFALLVFLVHSGNISGREVLRFDGVQVTYTCPEQCWCGQTVISCISARLTELPPLPRDAPDVRQLWLTGNKLTRLDRNSFSALPGLVSLDLDDNEIEEVDRDAFSGLPELRALYLAYNKVTDLDLTSLYRSSPRLRHVDLVGQEGRLTCDVPDTAAREQPHLVMYYSEPCNK